MASGFPDISQIQGVDLSNYIRDPNSYNPIVYIHKKYYHANYQKNTQPIPKLKETLDKSIQIELKNNPRIKTKIINESNDPVVEQTIKFAKDIIPLTIPPSTDDSQNSVKYTIKTCKKSKRCKKIEPNITREKDVTFDKDKTKLKYKTRESYSGRESTNFSSQNNTLDDINENRSLCCSLSDLSEKRNLKRERYLKNRQNNLEVIASESFECLATENINKTNEVKLKIQLMNDKEKSLIYEKINMPVIKAMRDCMMELHSGNEASFELQNLQRNLLSNTQKIDTILAKLICIENALENFTEKPIKMPVKQKQSISKLEELEKDVLVKESSSEEELVEIHLSKKKKGKSTVSLSSKDEKIEDDDKNMDHGEEIPSRYQVNEHNGAQKGIKAERPNRIPARFCWTDATKK